MGLAPLHEIEALGLASGHADDALTRLGVRVCELASQRLVDVDDATRIYDGWSAGRHANGRRAQRSEPRENREMEIRNLIVLIELGAKRKLAGVQTLRRMLALHDSGARERVDGLDEEHGRYACLVETARRQLAKGAGMLTEAELRSVIGR